MSTKTHNGQRAELDRYLHSLGTAGPGLLGWIALFSFASIATEADKPGDDGGDPVTAKELTTWLDELGFSTQWVPSAATPVEAYERATRITKKYPVGDRKRDHLQTGQTVTLMMRDVSRDEDRIVRHLVRELVDHGDEALSYEVKVAEAVFRRGVGDDGEMDLEITDTSAMDWAEQQDLEKVLDAARRDYVHRQGIISADRLRKIVRTILEDELRAVRVHQGVYFVHHTQTDRLDKLAELVHRIGEKRADEELSRVPLPDIGEMRTMVEDAAEAKVDEDLRQLQKAIVKARRGGAEPADYQVKALAERYLAIKRQVAEYQERMGTELQQLEDRWDTAQRQWLDLRMAEIKQQNTPNQEGDDQ
jgi:uncharacterized protein DUF6744